MPAAGDLILPACPEGQREAANAILQRQGVSVIFNAKVLPGMAGLLPPIPLTDDVLLGSDALSDAHHTCALSRCRRSGWKARDPPQAGGGWHWSTRVAAGRWGPGGCAVGGPQAG